MDINESTTQTSEYQNIQSPENDEEQVRVGIAPCCRITIDQHGTNNPMMVCGECKQIIKCFDKELAFKNYYRFCLSRNRRFTADQYKGWFVISFRSYDTFNT